MLEILDKSEEEYVLDSDDENYVTARKIWKGKRGAID